MNQHNIVAILSLALTPPCAIGAALVSDGRIDAQIMLPQDIRIADADAANLMAKSLAKLADNGIVNVEWFGAKPRDGAFNIEMRNLGIPPLNPNSDDSHIDALKRIRIDVSKNKALIEYPNSDSAHAAADIFLEKFCGFYNMAPGALGEEYERKKHLEIPDADAEYTRPFVCYKFYAPGTSWFNRKGASNMLGFPAHNTEKIFDGHAFEKNPNFFGKLRVKNGKLRHNRNAQIDFLNKECEEFASDYIARFLIANPAKEGASLGVKDNDLYSETPESLANSDGYEDGLRNFSPQVFRFTNAVAKRFPKKFIFQHAYRGTISPPPFPLEKNVIVAYSSDKAEWRDAEYAKLDAERIAAWGKISRFLMIWDYLDGEGYFIPNPVEKHSFKALNAATQANAVAYFGEAVPFWAFDTQKSWIMATKLNGDGREFEELQKLFFDKFYHKAAAPMLEFFEIARQAWDSRKAAPRWLSLMRSESQALIFSGDTIGKMESALAEAERAERSGKVALRIAQVRLAFNFTKDSIYSYLAKVELSELVRNSPDADKIFNSIQKLKAAEKRRMESLRELELKSVYPRPPTGIWKREEMCAPIDAAAAIIMSSNPSPEQMEKLKSLVGIRVFENAKRYAESSPNAQNLILDGGFEKYMFDCRYPVNKSPWTTIDTDCQGRRFAVSESAARSGKYGLLLSNCETSAIAQNFSVKAGEICAFSGYAKGDFSPGTNIYANLTFKNAEGNIIGRKTLILFPSSENFSKFLLMEAAPPDSASVNAALFASYMKDGETVFIDDLEFKILKTH